MRSIVGIDIRSDHISAVRIAASLKKVRLAQFERIQWGADESHDAGLTAALKALAQRMALADALVVVGLPAGQVMFRNLAVPFEDTKKVDQILPFELERTLPSSAEDTAIGFSLLPGTKGENLLAAAVSRRVLATYTQALKEAGIQPARIVPAGLALAQQLANQLDQGQQALLLDTDDRQAVVFVLENAAVQTVRCLLPPLTSVSQVDACARALVQTLAGFSLRRCQSVSPHTIWVTGRAAASDAILDRLARRLEQRLEFVDLLAVRSEVDRNGAGDNWQPARMDAALALALLGAEGRPSIDLHRSRSTVATLWARYRTMAVTTLSLACLVAVLALGKVVVETYRLKAQVRQVQQQIAHVFQRSVSPDTRMVEPVTQMKQVLASLTGRRVTDTNARPPLAAVVVLDRIAGSIAPQMKVSFSRLVLGPEAVTLAGKTTGFDVVDAVKGNLEKTGVFTKVTITSATADKSGNQVQFKMRLELGPPKELR